MEKAIRRENFGKDFGWTIKSTGKEKNLDQQSKEGMEKIKVCCLQETSQIMADIQAENRRL